MTAGSYESGSQKRKQTTKGEGRSIVRLRIGTSSHGRTRQDGSVILLAQPADRGRFRREAQCWLASTLREASTEEDVTSALAEQPIAAEPAKQKMRTATSETACPLRGRS